jgi:long-chain acyl-CoA synthetase
VFNLATILRESAMKSPDKPVTLLDGNPMSYAELDQASDRVAANLQSLGVNPGDTVGIQLPNIPQFLMAYFGVLKAGAVAVPMNVLLKAPEVAFYLGDSGAKVLITFAGFLDDAAKGAAEAGVKDVFAVGVDDSNEKAKPFEQLLATASGTESPHPVFETREPQDTAVIIYTSGTTGKPKGAELSHFTLYMNCDIPGRLFDMQDNDVVITALPLFHVFGLSSVLNTSVRFAGTMSLIPRFDAGTVLETIQRDHATIMEGVPTMFVALLHHPDVDNYDVSTLRMAVSGGAPIPAEVMDAFEKKFGVVILEGYGLSETASTTTFNVSAEERKAYSVGKPIWGTETQIWSEDGQLLPPGKDNVGELVTRGAHVMKGYLNRPEETAEAFAGGWFHTGDLGYMDEDGFFFIVDRKKELIIRGGYNVYPREVEEVLYAHPSVAEVAVIGVPDDRLGEEVRAVIALKSGQTLDEAEAIAFCKERLAAYKYPRSVQFIDALPKNATGKILKKELKV